MLYLDFDGVLHPPLAAQTKHHGVIMGVPSHALFENVPLLERALEPYGDVKIVLSSTWVQARSFSYAKSRLSEALQRRVIGATYHRRVLRQDEFNAMPRGVQIQEDSQRRGACGWIALDDEDEGWPASCLASLVKCAGDSALADPDTLRVLADKLEQLYARYLRRN